MSPGQLVIDDPVAAGYRVGAEVSFNHFACGGQRATPVLKEVPDCAGKRHGLLAWDDGHVRSKRIVQLETARIVARNRAILSSTRRDPRDRTARGSNFRSRLNLL